MLVLLNSCGFFTFLEPQIRQGEEIHITKINGKQIDFSFEATVYNPNGYGLKVKPSLLDVYVEGEYIGKVRLNEKVKSDPAMMAGQVIGKITLRKVLPGLAPKSAEASIIESGSFSIPA